MGSPAFLQTLIAQQRPQVILSNIASSSLAGIVEGLNREDVRWIHRINPEDIQSKPSLPAFEVLVGEDKFCAHYNHAKLLPYIKGLDSAIGNGADPTSVLQGLKRIIANGDAYQPPSGLAGQTHLIMRQPLFCNSSLGQITFELTNALLECGVPAVPQEEHAILFGNGCYRDEDWFRLNAPEKYERVRRNVCKEYDPESAITLHFALINAKGTYTYYGTFPSFGGREILYTTENHTVNKYELENITDRFGLILAPSAHVMRAYFKAGLDCRLGSVIPYGIDPLVCSPDIVPVQYPTKKHFKFLQTGLPEIHEKGFDLAIKAFCRAFSNRDDVSLILRILKIQQSDAWESQFEKLQLLVNEELAKPGAPEILLLETDAESNRRGDIYTGASCYVHPLRTESFGIPILEAMACGLPVIATPWSGPADFLSPQCAYTLQHSTPVADKKDDRVPNYYVQPELDHLIHCMRYAYEHEEEGKTLGQRASHMVHKNWTWKQAATKLAKLFFNGMQ